MSIPNNDQCTATPLFSHKVNKRFKEKWVKMSDKEKIDFMDKRIKEAAAEEEVSDYLFYHND